MKHLRNLPYILGVVACSFLACNDATVIGSELVSGEELDVEFTDTVSFNVFSQIVDTVTTYNLEAGIIFDNFPFGKYNDPIFGASTASMYAQVTTSASGSPDFGNTKKLDSIVLILPYNPDDFYGDVSQSFSLEVFQLAESLADSTNFNSGTSYMLGDMIGAKDFVPDPDSVFLYVPRLDSVARFIPQLRVRLDEGFEDAFFKADPTNFENSDNFEAFFHGFHIRPVSENAGMVNFKMREIGSEAGLKVYFQDTIDNEFEEYLFPIFSTQAVSAHFEHDYAGSVAEPFLGENAGVKDSLLFVQAMAGINVTIEFPHLENLGDIVVNEAILEFPILTLEGDDPDLYANPSRIVVGEVLEEGGLDLISDVDFALGNDFSALFGGDPVDGVYRMNISSYFQDAKVGLVNNQIEVFITAKPMRASRLVLAGPGYSANPAKLKLTYTNF